MRSRWTVPTIIVLTVSAWSLNRYVIAGKQVGEDDLIGLTKQEVLLRYGEPDLTFGASGVGNSHDDDNWCFQRGMYGGSTGVHSATVASTTLSFDTRDDLAITGRCR